MQVKEIMSKRIISCQEDELVSKALGKMQEEKIHQLIVLGKKDIKGVVSLYDIVKREFDPSTTKVSAVMNSTPTIKSLATLEEAADLIINSNSRMLPVVDRELIGIVSETDIIKNLDIDFNVDEISQLCMYVNPDDNIGKVKNIMIQNNISRVPVLKSGKLIGVIGTYDMINLMHESKSANESRGWGLKSKGFKEKMNFDATLANTLMRDAASVRKPVRARKVLDMLKKNEEVFIINGDVKIVTPKDVLKLLIKPKKTEYIQISGLEDEDAMTVATLHKIIENTIKPISKVNEIQSLHMFIEHHKKQGNKIKYSIKAQLPTQRGTIIVSKVWGYNLITAMQEAMNNMERDFWKRHEKLTKGGKADKRMARGK